MSSRTTRRASSQGSTHPSDPAGPARLLAADPTPTAGALIAAPEPHRGPGRPPAHTDAEREALQAALLARMADGESVRAACEALGMNRGLVWRWAEADAAFAGRYARAREEQVRVLVEDLVEIADEPAGATAEAEARRRARLDIRKWVASKVLHREYGERVQQTHDGAVDVRVRYDDERSQGTWGTQGVLGGGAAAELPHAELPHAESHVPRVPVDPPALAPGDVLVTYAG